MEYTGTIASIASNEAETLGRNFGCAPLSTFIGLPPSVKESFQLPSGTPVALTVGDDPIPLSARVAGGRGGLIRLTKDVIELLGAAPGASVSVVYAPSSEREARLIVTLADGTDEKEY